MKTILTTAGLLLAAWLVWQFAFLGNPPWTIFLPPPPEPPIPAVLDEPSSVDVVDAPIDAVVAELAKRHRTTIQVQPSGLLGTNTVTCKLQGVTLRSVLNHLLRQVSSDLCVASWNGTLTITSRQEQDLPSHRVERMHSIVEWIALDADRGVGELLQMFFSSDGDPFGPEFELDWLPGVLLLSATPERHADLADLLAKLTELARQPNAVATVRVGEARTPALEAIERVLTQRTSLRFEGQPLSAVAAELQRRWGVPVIVDTLALQMVGQTDPRVFGEIDDVPARYALEALLAPHSLRAFVRDEAVCIATPGFADEAGCLRLYPIHDLLERSEPDELRQMIREFAVPMDGKPGNMRTGLQLAGSTLVAQGTEQYQRNIEEFLFELREVVASHSPSPRWAGPRAWLNHRVTVRHDSIRWEDFLRALERQYGFAFRVAPSAFESALLDPPIDVAADNEPLDILLERLLLPLHLYFHADAHRIVITSESESPLQPRMYRLRPIFADERREPTNEEWRQAIRVMLSKDREHGDHKVVMRGEVAIVRARQRDHGRLERMLTACREARLSGRHRAHDIPDSSRRFRLYPVQDLLAHADNESRAHTNSEAELTSFIALLFSPGESRRVAGLPGLLLADASSKHHDEIERLLTALRAASARPAPVRSMTLRDDHLTALVEPATLQVGDEPLEGLIAELAKKHGVPIAFADAEEPGPELGGERRAAAPERELRVLGANLETALDWLMRSRGRWLAEGPTGLIVQARGPTENVLRLYDVSHLLPKRGAALNPEWFARPRGVWDLFQHLTQSNWLGNDTAVRHGGLMAVRGRRSVHRLVERLLAAERRGSKTPQPDDPWVALEQPVSLTCTGLSASDAVAQLAARVPVPIIYWADGPAAPPVTLDVRDMPLREVVRRLRSPPFGLELVVADELLVVVPQDEADRIGGTFTAFDVRRLQTQYPALTDLSLVELLRGRSGLQPIAGLEPVACFRGWLLVNAGWRELADVHERLVWLERAAPTLSDLNRSGQPRDVALLMSQARGKAGPMLRSYALWRLSLWKDPDETTVRTVTGWLRDGDETSDWERSLIRLLGVWGLPADAVPWVLPRIAERSFVSQEGSYFRLLVSSGTAGQAEFAKILRTPTPIRLPELFANAPKDIRVWLWQPLPDLLADLGRPSATKDELARFTHLVSSLGPLHDELGALVREWQGGDADEQALVERYEAAMKAAGF